MSIVDASVIDQPTNSGSASGEYALQKPSGNRRLLLALISTGDVQGGGEYKAYPTSVTFDGLEMVEAVKSEANSSGYIASCFIYYLDDQTLPTATGTYPVTASFEDGWVEAASLSLIELDSVDQSNPIAGIASETDFGQSTLLEPSDSGSLLISIAHVNNDGGNPPTLSVKSSAATTVYVVTEGAQGETWFDKEDSGGLAYEEGASAIGWTVDISTRHQAHSAIAIAYEAGIPAIRTEKIYEPNQDSPVADANNVTVRIWKSSSISGAPDDVLTNQTISDGILESRPTGMDVGDSVSYQLSWTTSADNDRFIEAKDQTVEDATAAPTDGSGEGWRSGSLGYSSQSSSPSPDSGPWPDNLLAYEDFESGDLNDPPPGMTWGTGTSTSVHPGIGTDGSYALRFLYSGNTDPEEDAWAEHEFVMDGEYSELWVGFRLFVASNYHHRDVSPSNNKLCAIYMDGYSSKGEGPTVIWNMWDDNAGGSRVAVHYAWGSNNTANSHVQHTPFITYPDDQGRSMQLAFRVVAASARGADDGIIELWRRWDDEGTRVRLHEMTDADIAPAPDNPVQGWKQGKVLGWANSGFDNDTAMVVDDFVVSENSLVD